MDKEAHTHRPSPSSLKHLSATSHCRHSGFLALSQAHTKKNTRTSSSFFKMSFWAWNFQIYLPFLLSPHCVLAKLFFFFFKVTSTSVAPSFTVYIYPLCPQCSLPSVQRNGSYFHPRVSVTVAAGWLNIYIFHSLVTFPCCHSGSSSLLAARAVDRLLSANLIWTQRIVHRESGTWGSETGERWKKEREIYCSHPGPTLGTLPANGLKRQRCGGSIRICKHMGGVKVVLLHLLLCHLDCGFLSVINYLR